MSKRSKRVAKNNPVIDTLLTLRELSGNPNGESKEEAAIANAYQLYNISGLMEVAASAAPHLDAVYTTEAKAAEKQKDKTLSTTQKKDFATVAKSVTKLSELAASLLEKPA